ncbi:MAG: 2-oxo acid dehydrogenase subunit E2 [Ruminococcaceae bacterium]|nr:2-oxo acid dehydrogenase subunit E2 [Oscillospiraceae bacterium]
MATPIIMPRQGQSVESCIISKWHKKVGDMVAEGDTLFSYETDKASFDEVAKVSGKMLAIFYEEGDDVECLLNVCVVGNDGESTAEFAPAGAEAAAPAPVAAAPVAAAPAASAPANPTAPVDAGNATPVIMPRQGQSVESCIISKWHKKVGDMVAEGDTLFSYETDKASFDEVAKVSGKMLAIFFEEGDDVECLLNVCVIGEDGANANAFNPNATAAPAAEASAPIAAAPVAVAPAAVVSTAKAGDALKISPRAKNLAEKTFADISLATPTGPNGRIIERDVERLISEGKVVTPAAADALGKGIVGTGLGGRVTTADIAAAASAPASAPAVEAVAAPVAEYEEVPMTNIRKVIAKSMSASLTEMAQLTLNTSFDATAILNYRKVLKNKGEAFGMEKVTLNDMILYAVSRIILNHRDINAHLIDNKMRLFNNVHLGVACDTARGLMVPTVFNANKMSLKEISAESKRVTGMCRDGACSPDLLKGASFTITNLGSLGIESFTPVINPPQTAILGVCGTETKIREKNGEISTYQAMGLSLTFDHRAVDGAPAAKFLKELCEALENFDLLLGV